MTDRENLIELLTDYFDIGDSYAYNLTRVKTAFAVGTVSLDDFEEFDDATVAKIADYLLANGVTFARPKNTLIEYAYRDASNYKNHASCIVVGVLTDSDKASILDSLSEGEFFIPENVGMLPCRFGEYDPAEDHPWHTISDFSETDEAPTLPITAAELAANFRRRKDNWDFENIWR